MGRITVSTAVDRAGPEEHWPRQSPDRGPSPLQRCCSSLGLSSSSSCRDPCRPSGSSLCPRLFCDPCLGPSRRAGRVGPHGGAPVGARLRHCDPDDVDRLACRPFRRVASDPARFNHNIIRQLVDYSKWLPNGLCCALGRDFALVACAGLGRDVLDFCCGLSRVLCFVLFLCRDFGRRWTAVEVRLSHVCVVRPLLRSPSCPLRRDPLRALKPGAPVRWPLLKLGVSAMKTRLNYITDWLVDRVSSLPVNVEE